jgi:hypothetical protein
MKDVVTIFFFDDEDDCYNNFHFEVKMIAPYSSYVRSMLGTLLIFHEEVDINLLIF